jgi:hypothetical protein
MINIDQSYVAMVDILGFGELVTNNSHEQLRRTFDNLFTHALHYGLSFGTNVDSPKGGVQSDLAKARVNSLVISDSVILWTRDDSPNSFMDLTMTLRGFVSASFVFGFPLRGAVSRGPIEVTMGQNIASSVVIQTRVLGKSLVDAYRLEKKQDWSGCIFSHDVIEHYSSNLVMQGFIFPSIQLLIEQDILAEYDIPMKNGVSIKHIALNWTNAWRNELDRAEVEETFARFGKNIDGSDVRSKIENTIKFIDYARHRIALQTHG